jgi:hypothetical protein
MTQLNRSQSMRTKMMNEMNKLLNKGVEKVIIADSSAEVTRK